jgi:catechol 2,3-dioxygenase-like lactoylglutathione lyase family enzyme
MSEPQVLRSAPYFPVAAVAPTVAYYERILGFRTEYVGGDEFAIVSRDGYPLMFRRVEQPDRIRPSEAQGGTWDAFFWVRDAQALREELVSKGAVVVYGPVVQEAYQMLELAVRDPDGHVLGFGQAL